MYIIGADIGRAQDFTAVSVLQVVELEHKSSGRERNSHGGYSWSWESRSEYHLRALDRLDIGTPYRDIVERLRDIGEKTGDDSLYYVLDISGVGRPVYELAREVIKRGTLDGMILTSGTEEVHDPQKHLYQVPKVNLVSALQIAFSSGYLKAAEGIPMLELLVHELQSFRFQAKQAGEAGMVSWREAPHDDLIFSLAIALHGAMRHRRPIDGGGFSTGGRRWDGDIFGASSGRDRRLF